MRRLVALVTALGATACMAQQPPPTEGARDLFFAGAAPKDDLPPVRHPAAPAKAPPATAPAKHTRIARLKMTMTDVHLNRFSTQLLTTAPRFEKTRWYKSVSRTKVSSWPAATWPATAGMAGAWGWVAGSDTGWVWAGCLAGATGAAGL